MQCGLAVWMKRSGTLRTSYLAVSIFEPPILRRQSANDGPHLRMADLTADDTKSCATSYTKPR